MTTIEGNKLIEEFMGKEWRCKYDSTDQTRIEFHLSWDWLMPVVEKIEITNRVNDNEYYPYMVTIWKARCEITDGNNGNKIASGYTENDKIKAVWTAIVSFIQWYNFQIK